MVTRTQQQQTTLKEQFDEQLSEFQSKQAEDSRVDRQRFETRTGRTLKQTLTSTDRRVRAQARQLQGREKIRQQKLKSFRTRLQDKLFGRGRTISGRKISKKVVATRQRSEEAKKAQEARPGVIAARQRIDVQRERRVTLPRAPKIRGRVDVTGKVVTPLRQLPPIRGPRFLEPSRERVRDFTGFRDEPTGRIKRVVTRPVGLVAPTEFEPGLSGTAQRLGRRASQAEVEAQRRISRGEILGGFLSRGKAAAFGLGELGAGIGSLITQPGPAIRGAFEFGKEFVREPRKTTRRLFEEAQREPARTTGTFLGIAATGPVLGGVGGRVGRITAKAKKQPTITVTKTTGRRIRTPEKVVDITQTDLLGIAGKTEIRATVGAVETTTKISEDVAFTARELGADITVKPPFGKPKRLLAREQAIGRIGDDRFLETAEIQIAKPGKQPVRPPLREVRVGVIEDIGVFDDIKVRRATVLGFEETGRPVSVAAGIEREIPITPKGDLAKLESGVLQVDKNLRRVAERFRVGGGGVGRRAKISKKPSAPSKPSQPKQPVTIFQEPVLAPPVPVTTTAQRLVKTAVVKERVARLATTGRVTGRLAGRTTGILTPITATRPKTTLALDQIRAVTAIAPTRQVPITRITPLLDIKPIVKPAVKPPSTITTPLIDTKTIQRFGGGLFGPGGGLAPGAVIGAGVPGKPGAPFAIPPLLAFPGDRTGVGKKVKTKKVKAKKPGLKELSFRLFEDDVGPALEGKGRIFGPRPIPKRFKSKFESLDRLLRL